MNLDELRAVQNKERQKDSLQHLRESFYADVADYVERLREERDAAADAVEDPFADPEVRQLTDEIETATDVAEAVYERRLGKLVKRASLAAADMPADDEGLTAEERALFDDLVDRITENKERVLDVVEGEADPLAGAEGATATDVASATEADAGGRDEPARAGRTTGKPAAGTAEPTTGGPAVGAADAMGGNGDGGGEDPVAATADASRDDATAPPAPGGDGRGDEGRPSGDVAGPDRADPTGPAADDDSRADGRGTHGGMDDRTTVRITDDVGSIFGVEGREYDLDEDDVVSLPAANAAPLVERGAAERVD